MDDSAASPPPPSVSPARILVVDDELSLLKTFPRLLRPHIVELASSGALALARLSALPAFDVVLCDLHLDDIDGRAAFPRAPSTVAGCKQLVLGLRRTRRSRCGESACLVGRGSRANLSRALVRRGVLARANTAAGSRRGTPGRQNPTLKPST